MLSANIDTTALVALLDSHFNARFRFLYDTANNPFEGGEYTIFALKDEVHDRQVAVRVPKSPPGPITSMMMQSEIETRRRIDAARIDRFQPLLACDATADNDLKHPYMVIGWAQGNPVGWSGSIPKLEADRQNVLRAIANVCLDLLQVQESGMPALEWITAKIDRKIARAVANRLPYGTVAECEKQKSLIPDYWIPQLDDAPHVLVHGDLSGNNIIVDKDWEVTSVIDLGWAESMPLQFAAEFPRILVHEPIPSQYGYSWTQKDSGQLQKDRDFYLQCIKDRAEREVGLVTSYYEILSRRDEINRYWWYTAASRSDVHQAMSLCDWSPMSAISGGR